MIFYLMNRFFFYISSETIYQRDPLPNMSEHNEVETELADHKKMAQKDVEVKKDQVRTGEELCMFWSPLNIILKDQCQ